MRRTFAALAGLAMLTAAAPALSQTNTAAPAADATKAIPAASPKASVEATTIGDLVDNPKTKAVLQQDMPELLTYDGLDQIRGMTMRDISKYPQANLDQARLEKIQKDLDGIGTP
jgi:para-nitrobenzyl esterase